MVHRRVCGLAVELFTTVAEQCRCGGILKNDISVHIDAVNALYNRFENQLAPAPQLRQRLFGALALREISKKSTEYPAAAVSYRRDRQLHGKFVPVAVQRRELDPPVEHRSLAGFEKPPHATLLCLAILGWDNFLGHGLADCLFPSPAKGIFRL